jgi:hypothetical protein
MQKIYRNIGFWKNAKCFAQNSQKSQKIRIVTSTPGHPVSWPTLALQATEFERIFSTLARVIKTHFPTKTFGCAQKVFFWRRTEFFNDFPLKGGSKSRSGLPD